MPNVNFINLYFIDRSKDSELAGMLVSRSNFK